MDLFLIQIRSIDTQGIDITTEDNINITTTDNDFSILPDRVELI